MSQYSLADFRNRLDDTTLGSMPAVSIGLDAARVIAEMVDWERMGELAAESRRFLPQVETEIVSLKAALAAAPERMHRRAFLFGIAAPNRDERASIGWALSVEHHYGILGPRALARKSYRSLFNGRRCQIGFYDALASTLFKAELSGVDCDNVARLEALPGVGPKVARMIHAVTHPAAPVWTVDLWHMRQLLWAAGIDWRCRVGTGGPAYQILEALWLEYAARFFPGVDTWAVQWATWCAAEGAFLTHAALWADLAPARPICPECGADAGAAFAHYCDCCGLEMARMAA